MKSRESGHRKRCVILRYNTSPGKSKFEGVRTDRVEALEQEPEGFGIGERT